MAFSTLVKSDSLCCLNHAVPLLTCLKLWTYFLHLNHSWWTLARKPKLQWNDVRVSTTFAKWPMSFRKPSQVLITTSSSPLHDPSDPPIILLLIFSHFGFESVVTLLSSYNSSTYNPTRSFDSRQLIAKLSIIHPSNKKNPYLCT